MNARRTWFLLLAALLVGVGIGLAATLARDDPGEAAPTEEPARAPAAFGIATGAELTGGRSAEERARELDGIRELGNTAVRFDAAWSSIEREPGALDWSAVDGAVHDSRARNLDVLLTLTYAPAWANEGQPDNKYAPATEEMRQAFAEFAAAAVARYWPEVRAFEIWNEPNHVNFWKPFPDAAAYTDLLRRAHAAIEAVQPDAVVVGGALALASGESGIHPLAFTEQMYAAGVQGSFDALSVHPYVSGNEPIPWERRGSWFGPCPSVRCTVLSREPEKQLWFTETGDVQLATTSPEVVGTVLGRLKRYQEEGWGGPAYWYAYRSVDSYSLVDEAWNPRPAWFAYRDWMAAND